jgi:hypothetical protein
MITVTIPITAGSISSFDIFFEPDSEKPLKKDSNTHYINYHSLRKQSEPNDLQAPL